MRPVTAQPGFVEADTHDLLATGQFVYADCFTIEPLIGDPLRYTTAQQNVSVVPVGFVGRQTYFARQVLIKGLRVKNNLGVEVDEQEVQMDYSADILFQAALSWPQALLTGRLDGASIRRDRYFAPSWDQAMVGGCPMFKGLVSSLNRVGRQTATINVKSDLVLLNVQMPSFLFEGNCKNTWGDAGCGIDQADWAVAGVIGASPTRTTIPWSSSSTTYALGKIHIENGDSVTRVRTVSRADATHLYLSYPLDFDPEAGMDFVAYPGCNRTKDRCPDFWGPTDWVEHFKGFPFVPVAETAIG